MYVFVVVLRQNPMKKRFTLLLDVVPVFLCTNPLGISQDRLLENVIFRSIFQTFFQFFVKSSCFEYTEYFTSMLLEKDGKAEIDHAILSRASYR